MAGAREVQRPRRTTTTATSTGSRRRDEDIRAESLRAASTSPSVGADAESLRSADASIRAAAGAEAQLAARTAPPRWAVTHSVAARAAIGAVSNAIDRAAVAPFPPQSTFAARRAQSGAAGRGEGIVCDLHRRGGALVLLARAVGGAGGRAERHLAALAGPPCLARAREAARHERDCERGREVSPRACVEVCVRRAMAVRGAVGALSPRAVGARPVWLADALPRDAEPALIALPRAPLRRARLALPTKRALAHSAYARSASAALARCRWREFAICMYIRRAYAYAYAARALDVAAVEPSETSGAGAAPVNAAAPVRFVAVHRAPRPVAAPDAARIARRHAQRVVPWKAVAALRNALAVDAAAAVARLDRARRAGPAAIAAAPLRRVALAVPRAVGGACKIIIIKLQH